MVGVSYGVLMDPQIPRVATLRASVIWIQKVDYIAGKEIPDLSTQQQGIKSILVNSESLSFVDLCYGF